ncbi:MAG: VIT1/CCC1 transporter family protein [Candidatus Paceibacterota bacterium]
MRNFIFGVEDSLVSTVGALSGINIAGLSRADILLAGVVLIFVEAFSMAAGSFLSERSTEEYMGDGVSHLKHSFINGSIMFFSYFFAGFIPIFPYIFTGAPSALWISVSLSLFALFALGLVSGKMTGVNIFKSGLRIFLVGGLAVALGVAVGRLVG